MRITRIYQPIPLTSGATVTLDSTASNHLLNVLRLTTGAPLRLFNGEGAEFVANIEAVSKKLAMVKIGEQIHSNRESPLSIHLAQGIARGEKMDFILQKAVELGVNKITPLFTEHSNVKLTAERLTQKLAHWQGVINHACEQSGRNKIPELMPAITYSNWVTTCAEPVKLMLHPDTKHTLKDFNSTPEAVCVAIGPEGGFSDKEIQLAERHHFQTISLGPRILRTETAGLAIVTALQVKWGDLG